MTSGEKKGSPAGPPASEKAATLEKEIEGIRGELDGMVGELDRRRHQLFDVKRQFGRHALPLIAVAAALLGIAAGGIAFGISRRRRQGRLGVRLAHLQEAVRRMIAKPEQVANTPGVGRKVVGAAGAAAATIVAKALTRRALGEQPRERQM